MQGFGNRLHPIELITQTVIYVHILINQTLILNTYQRFSILVIIQQINTKPGLNGSGINIENLNFSPTVVSKFLNVRTPIFTPNRHPAGEYASVCLYQARFDLLGNQVRKGIFINFLHRGR